MNNNNAHAFKVSLIGDGGVGKTALLKRSLIGEFVKKYVPTLGVEVHPLDFKTSAGQIILNIWDCAGQEKFSGLREGYWQNSDLFIIAYDASAKITAINVQKYVEEVRSIVPDAKILIVGCKADIKSRFRAPKFKGIETLEFSAKSCLGLEKMWVKVMKMLVGTELELSAEQA